MKKIIKLIVGVFVVFISQQCFAESSDVAENLNIEQKTEATEYSNIKAGDKFFSFQMGYVSPQNKLDIDSYSLSWGKGGFGLGVQYLYFVADQFAIGAEIDFNSFSTATSYDVINVDASSTNYMLAFRFNLSDTNGTRVYIPFGLGMASKKARISISYPYMHETSSHTDLAYNIGIGIEHEIERGNAIGAELKYNSLKWDEEDFNQDFKYISIKIRFSFKV